MTRQRGSGRRPQGLVGTVEQRPRLTALEDQTGFAGERGHLGIVSAQGDDGIEQRLGQTPWIIQLTGSTSRLAEASDGLIAASFDRREAGS